MMTVTTLSVNRMLRCVGILLVTMIYVLGYSGCAKLFNLADDNTPTPSPLVTFTPTANVFSVWSQQTGGGFDRDDLLLHIAASSNALFTSSASGNLVALDQKTGNRLWSQSADMSVTGGPAAGSNIVVVAGSDGQVAAYRSRNGELAWQAHVPNQVLAPPAVANGVVIVKTIDGHIQAFSAATGKPHWNYVNATPSLVLRGDSQPAIAGNVAVIGFADGKLLGFNIQSGQLLWQHAVSLPSGSTPLQQLVDVDAKPVIDGNIAYAANYHGNVTAVSMRDGQLLWEHQLSSYTGLTVDSSRVYVTDAQGDVWAFNKQTGTVDWRQQKLQARLLTAPVSMGQFVVVADAQGYVHWLDKRSGRFVARIDNGGVIKSPLIVRDSTLYVLTVSGKLSAYRLQQRR